MAQPRKRQLNLFDSDVTNDIIAVYAARRIHEMRSSGDVRPLRLLYLDIVCEVEDAIRGMDSEISKLRLPVH